MNKIEVKQDTILEESLDIDYWNSALYDIPYSLYLYYLDDKNFTNENLAILGNCSAIQSIQYTPFIDPKDIQVYKIPYDIKRFGDPESIRPELAFTPFVYRIRKQLNTVKELGTFKLYDTTGTTIGGERNWKNESRLYNYPYSFALLTDYLNPPINIKYHLCNRRDTQTVKVKQTLSDRCSYGLFIDQYKNDVNGKMESLVSGDAHELPCTSSAYGQWFASSKNQTRFGMQQNIQESFLQQRQGAESSQIGMISSAIGSFAGIAGGLLTGDIGGASSALIGGGSSLLQNTVTQNQLKQTGKLQRQGIVGSMLAQQKDLKSTPNTLLSMGSDAMYGIVNGEKRVDLIRYMLNIEFAQKLGDYFALYGYKQNKIRSIERRDRYYYNYIKTVGVNVRSQGMPREHLDKIKEIYDNGVTIWHVDRNGVEVDNYSKDNYEV